jgi:hypothetical protein
VLAQISKRNSVYVKAYVDFLRERDWPVPLRPLIRRTTGVPGICARLKLQSYNYRAWKHSVRRRAIWLEAKLARGEHPEPKREEKLRPLDELDRRIIAQLYLIMGYE